MTKIAKSSSSDSKFVFKEDSVIKSFPIESGLHYNMAIRFFEYYKSIGVKLEYDCMFINSNQKIGYFITKFPKLMTLENINIDGKKIIDKLIEKILTLYPIPILKVIQKSLEDKNITVHTRDTKSRNLFMYNEQLYLLDIADFYFVIRDKDNESICLNQDYMDKYKIKPFIYKYDEKYKLPKNVYTYELKGVLQYE